MTYQQHGLLKTCYKTTLRRTRCAPLTNTKKNVEKTQTTIAQDKQPHQNYPHEAMSFTHKVYNLTSHPGCSHPAKQIFPRERRGCGIQCAFSPLVNAHHAVHSLRFSITLNQHFLCFATFVQTSMRTINCVHFERALAFLDGDGRCLLRQDLHPCLCAVFGGIRVPCAL